SVMLGFSGTTLNRRSAVAPSSRASGDEVEAFLRLGELGRGLGLDALGGDAQRQVDLLAGIAGVGGADEGVVVAGILREYGLGIGLALGACSFGLIISRGARQPVHGALFDLHRSTCWGTV